eukprot:4316918-Pleurochrysis_carterae.AAC.1
MAEIPSMKGTELPTYLATHVLVQELRHSTVARPQPPPRTVSATWMRRRRCCSTCASELAAARATRAQSWRDDLESAKCVWEGQRKRLHQGRWLRCVVRTSGWVEARMSASCTHAAAGRTMECEHVSGLRTRPQVWFIRACSRVQASASASRVKLSYPTCEQKPAQT